METFAHELGTGEEEYMTKAFVENELGQFEDLSPEEAARVLLEKTTGLDLTSEHGADTPARFVRMLRELTTSEDFEFTTFPAKKQDMVVMKNIPFVSLCNHHLAPFKGVCHIAYVPDEKIVGLSKLARTVKKFSRALQVQEELTDDIADYLAEKLQPLGVGVVMEAEHMCMSIRGVEVDGATTITSTMRGVFADHDRTAKAEFLALVNR